MRAVVYARQSLDATGEGASVARQREVCEHLCAARGWQIVEVCEDNSISAYSGKPRPGWERALGMARAGDVDVIVAWHVDRLTRSLRDLELLIGLAEQTGVKVVTASGDLDLTTDSGRLVARILASVARAEGERKSERQRLANTQAARNGRPAPGPRPIGYRRAGDTYEIVEHEAAAVRAGAEAVLSGVSLPAVAQAWNQAGLRTSQGGKPWRADSVRRALKSPRYAGHRTHRGQVVAENAWPAILTPETHAAVAALLGDPTRWLGGGGAARSLLTGTATCGVCAAPIRSSQANGRGTYRCGAPGNHVQLPRVEVDHEVGLHVVAVLSRPDARALLHRQGPDVEALREESSALRRRLDVLARTFADGTISEAQLRAGSETVRAQLDLVDRQLADAGRVDILGGLIGADDVAAAWAAMDLARQRPVVRALLKVTLQPAGRGARRFRPEVVEVTPA